jgi:hypothetical protein
MRLLLAQGGRPGLDDLAALDKQLHSNLLAVKACPPEDVESLGLTFSVEQQLFGRVRPAHGRLKLLVADMYCMPFVASASAAHTRQQCNNCGLQRRKSAASMLCFCPADCPD